MDIKILLIEDDPLILRMYETVFKFEKFEVVTARNGVEGLEKLEHFTPTIILLDIMMPKMTGIEVLKNIKANDETKNIPVVVLTNLSGSTDAEKALEMGAVKFIVKSNHKPKQVVADIKEIAAAYSRDTVPESHKSHS
jgi:two-component system, OmpR family, alkaline phosphatase synthesis response regulator PhoP